MTDRAKWSAHTPEYMGQLRGQSVYVSHADSCGWFVTRTQDFVEPGGYNGLRFIDLATDLPSYEAAKTFAEKAIKEAL